MFLHSHQSWNKMSNQRTMPKRTFLSLSGTSISSIAEKNLLSRCSGSGRSKWHFHFESREQSLLVFLVTLFLGSTSKVSLTHPLIKYIRHMRIFKGVSMETLKPSYIHHWVLLDCIAYQTTGLEYVSFTLNHSTQGNISITHLQSDGCWELIL